MTTNDSDVIILGGGLVGQTTALALAAHGLTSAVVDLMPAEALLKRGVDGRVSAIASASWNMFRAIGVGAALEGKGCPIASIRVCEGLHPGALDFRPAEEEGPLGIMFENRLLLATLVEASQRADAVALHMGRRAVEVERGPGRVTAVLDDGTELSAPLLLVAEGRRSATREAAGIRIASWSYHHVAMIACLYHEHPHDNVAYEIFYPEGPFALLPMLDDETGHRSALVWTVGEKKAPAYQALSDRAFLAEAKKRMGGFLGEISLAAPRAGYPLGFHNAAKITADRLALVGDSAHGMHPIAGQGLNVGLRDVAALAEILVEGARTGLDLGDPHLLARYERWRGLDTLSVALATDGLTRLFGIPGKTASAVRRFGMGLVSKLPPLQRKFVDEARGSSGDLPKLLQGETV